MGELIIVSGPPGSGKSTVGRALSARFTRSALVAGDDFFAFLDRGAVPPWEPASRAQNDVVISAAAGTAGRFAAGGYDVVYDGIVGPWYLPAFVTWSGVERVHYALLLPSEQECVDRVRARVGHPFSDEDATRHVHGQFAAAEIDPRHVLTGDGGPEATVSAIREAVADGALAYR